MSLLEATDTFLKHWVRYGSPQLRKTSDARRLLGWYIAAFHLPKNSGNSDWDVNGTHVYRAYHQKFPKF